MNTNNLNSIFERIASNQLTELDLSFLKEILDNIDHRQLELQLGKYVVNIGEGKEIHLGDRIYQKWDDDTVKSLMEIVKETQEAIESFRILIQNQLLSTSELPKQLPYKEYYRLKNLLGSERWREANEITRVIILKTFKMEKENYLKDEQIENFPCDVLKAIDKLWLQYSNGYFGFSVQKKIFNECKELKKFGKSVGWYHNQTWITSSEVNYTLTNIAKGHLPWGIMGVATFDNVVLDALAGVLRNTVKATVKKDWQKQLLADAICFNGYLIGDEVNKEEFKRNLEYEIAHDEPWWQGQRLEELKLSKLVSLFKACPKL